MKKASFLTATFLWCYCLNAQVVYQTASFLLEINSKSEVVKLVDRQNNVNYVPADHPGYLVRVKTTSRKELAPINLQADKNLLHILFGLFL